MATVSKESLFDNYINTLAQVIPTFESVCKTTGICRQILGTEDSFPYSDPIEEQQIRDRVEESEAWKTLSKLYDYAVEGIQPDALDDGSFVINSSEVLSLITTENYAPSASWHSIVRLGDGRHAIDAGMEIELDKLALLANATEQMVSNAINAGTLQARKIKGVVHVENTSARAWLRGRRGYQPTKRSFDTAVALAVIETREQLGTFLRERRLSLEGNGAGLRTVVGRDRRDRDRLEDGWYSLSINSVFPLADYYQVDRGAFFACLMRVFFQDELDVLTQAFK
jgi:hypothetical protein